jgi:hypothetical protein
MKLPQFRVRTLLLLTAIMGVVFAACANWPVKETPNTNWNLTVTPSGKSMVVPGRWPAEVDMFTGAVAITRPPTFNEWAIRASIASGILLAVFVLIGAWRGRHARSPAR